MAGVAVILAAAAFILAITIVFALDGMLGAVAFSVLPTLLIVDLALVGGLLAIRRPGNVIGLLLLAAGCLAALSFAAGYYVRLDDLMGRDRLPFVAPVAWIGTWSLNPAIGLMVVFLPLLYPTGRLPGPRWRIVAGVVVVALSIGTIASATAPGPLQGTEWVVNPVRLPGAVTDAIATAGTISNLAAPPVFLLVVASLVIRFRASRGVEREQLKWFLFVASIMAVALGFSIVSVGPISDAAWLVGLLSMACLPLAIGIAILRYRLYDIDRIMSRTVAYVAVTAVLVAVFTGVNLELEALLASLTQASTLAVAASTLAVFALFQPLRRRVQAVVDHRFNRQRYEADRIAASFAEHLRDQVDADRIRLELDRVLTQTVAPSRSVLWLRGEQETS
jgi:hypothetical protein